MEKMKIKVGILPNQFLKENGTFNKKEAIKLSGKIAGVCYDKEGFSHLENEPEEKTMRRVNRTLNSGHHSVYDHILRPRRQWPIIPNITEYASTSTPRMKNTRDTM
mgnify:CR=1 FL=1